MIKTLRFSLTAVSVLAITGLAPLATAQDATGYQVDRHTMMEQVGQASRILGGMARGQSDYDPRAAQAGMRVYVAVAAAYPYMFPEGTETGNDTRAAASIWDDQEGFIAAVNKFEADANAAIEPAGAGLESFQAAFGTVAANCRTCHETYRTPDE